MNDFINNFDIQELARDILDAIFTARDIVEPIFDQYRVLLYGISSLVSLIFFTFIVYILIKAKFFTSQVDTFVETFFAGNAILKRKMIHGWNSILKDLHGNDPKKHKDAIIKSDLMLGEIIRLAGYRGHTIHERLVQVPSAVLPNIEKLRHAHAVRDDLVKGNIDGVTRDEAIALVGEYRRAFQELDLID